MQINKTDSKKTIPIKEIDFWAMFLRFTNANNGKNRITDKQIKIFAYILGQKAGMSYFSKPLVNQVVDELKCSYSEVMKIKEVLLKIGIVTQITDPNDLRKKIILPSKSIIDLQNYIKKHSFVSFYYPFQIIADESTK